MTDNVQQEAPSAIPPRRAWYLNWFVVNLGLPVASFLLCGVGEKFITLTAIFSVGVLKTESAPLPGLASVMFCALLLAVATASLYLNIKVCGRYAKGKRWVYVMLVVGSTGLSTSLAFLLMSPIVKANV